MEVGWQVNYESARLNDSDHSEGRCGDFTIREFRFISRENGPGVTFSGIDH